jgi:hypothetical protein
MKKESIAIATGLAVAMLTVLLATTQLAYAQIESNGDTQDSSGDETITESNSFTNEPTQEANVECGEGATCTVNQESESNGGGPVTHGPINTSRSNIKSLRTASNP